MILDRENRSNVHFQLRTQSSNVHFYTLHIIIITLYALGSYSTITKHRQSHLSIVIVNNLVNFYKLLP